MFSSESGEAGHGGMTGRRARLRQISAFTYPNHVRLRAGPVSGS
jgi:hypothetical protein